MYQKNNGNNIDNIKDIKDIDNIKDIKDIKNIKDIKDTNDEKNEIINIEIHEKSDSTVRKTTSFTREILDWAKYILFSFIIAFIVTQFIIVNAVVPTESMMNNIKPGDRIIGFRLSYIFSKPERGDIVIFKNPDDKSVLYAKRIIGLSGETVLIKNGTLYIDNVIINETYLKEPPIGSFGPYKVPSGGYFMLGDNRNNSLDSRAWKNKYVKSADILGKVILRYFPAPRLF